MNINIQILKQKEVSLLSSFPKTTLYSRIKDGTFPPQFSLAGRSSGFLKVEVEEVLLAMVAGKNREEIRVLVKSLVQKRQELLGGIA